MSNIIIIINFSRSGGTLLSRAIGMLPNVILLSEINTNLGASTRNKSISSHNAVIEQVYNWYGIEVSGDSLKEVILNLSKICEQKRKQLIIRDYTYMDFRSNISNNWKPKYKFSLIDEIGEISSIKTFAFVRNAIDIYLSLGVKNIETFSYEYLRYVKELSKAGIKYIKYEDFVIDPIKTMKEICNLISLEYSNDFLDFQKNHNITGDNQLGSASRGFSLSSIKKLPRKWVNFKKRKLIDKSKDLHEANRLLRYKVYYKDEAHQSFFMMVFQKACSLFRKIIKQIKKNF
tara:strand:- start:14437 stop:15303 length:867 start_codon:yes stop_codon:yes gene_type:complete